ncbi:MAG: glycosyltransferase family 4 protein [Clostridia bacterium]|nr:glycosyltransferase family 4 protein [Clostridia bacterium]
MKFLFLDAYFEPEQTSFTHLETDLIDYLTDVGNKIEIICPTPTRGVTQETRRKYKRKKREILSDSVSIIRFAAPAEGKNPLIRAFRYFWCNLKTLRIGKKYKYADVVFSNSTPPTQGFIAAKVAKKLKIPFVYNLQDIFPDSLVNAGMTNKGSFLYKIGRKIEDYTYKNADKIIVISESFKKNIMEKGVPEGKIEVIPNWIDTKKIKPINREDNPLFEELGIDRKKFIVLYAGNFGASQGTDVIINAAKYLQGEPDIHFVLFGGGSEFERTVKQISEDNLTNITINPLLPPERISEVYSMGDVAIITCRAGVGNAGMPSKTWSIMACNTPIIASFDTNSELNKILSYYQAGVCVPPENAKALVSEIKLQKDNIYAYHNIRESIKKLCDKKTCIEKYECVFSSQNIKKSK